MNKLKTLLFSIIVSMFVLSSVFSAELLTDCKTFNSSDKGKHFELQNDISDSNQCLFFLEDDISVDCNNYSITADVPIWSFNQENISVSNCNLISNSNSDSGIDLFQTHNSIFENITISSNNYGIFLDESNENDFVCVTILNSTTGIYLTDSHNNSFSCLEVSNSTKAIYLEESSDNYFEGFIYNTTQAAIELKEDDTLIVGNIFEFLIQIGSDLIFGDVGEFSERFDSNQNNISNTFTVSNSEFNFLTPTNQTIDEVDIEINSSVFGNLISENINSSDIIDMYVSYFEYNSTTHDVEEYMFDNYTISVSKLGYSNHSNYYSYMKEYNFTLYSTDNLSISLINYSNTIFDNQTQEVFFEVLDLNNYTISNVIVELNGSNVLVNNISSTTYSFFINGSNLSLGSFNFKITAFNEFNVSTNYNDSITVVSSQAPKLTLELLDNYSLTNQSVTLNFTISSTETYNYTLITQFNETVISQNLTSGNISLNTSYIPTRFENVVFTLLAIDSNGLNASISKELIVYLDENFTFEIKAKTNITNKSTTSLEIINSTQQNNISNWYEFYVNNTLIQNSSNSTLILEVSNYSSSFYSKYDNVTNSTLTYLDVVAFIKNSIGVNSNGTHTFLILNSSNISAIVDHDSKIFVNNDLDVEIIYNSSLNYSFERVNVEIDNNETYEFNSTSFSISNLELGTHYLDFIICNIYDECIEIENQSVVVAKKTSSSSGGGGGSGGGSSTGNRNSNNDDEESSSGGLSSKVVITEKAKNEITQVVSTPFFEEVQSVDEEVLIYEVEQASLDIDEINIENGASGQFTQNIGSMIAIIIGFVVIAGIVYFALIKK